MLTVSVHVVFTNRVPFCCGHTASISGSYLVSSPCTGALFLGLGVHRVLRFWSLLQRVAGACRQIESFLLRNLLRKLYPPGGEAPPPSTSERRRRELLGQQLCARSRIFWQPCHPSHLDSCPGLLERSRYLGSDTPYCCHCRKPPGCPAAAYRGEGRRGRYVLRLV